MIFMKSSKNIYNDWTESNGRWTVEVFTYVLNSGLVSIKNFDLAFVQLKYSILYTIILNIYCYMSSFIALLDILNAMYSLNCLEYTNIF